MTKKNILPGILNELYRQRIIDIVSIIFLIIAIYTLIRKTSTNKKNNQNKELMEIIVNEFSCFLTKEQKDSMQFFPGMPFFKKFILILQKDDNFILYEKKVLSRVDNIKDNNLYTHSSNVGIAIIFLRKIFKLLNENMFFSKIKGVSWKFGTRFYKISTNQHTKILKWIYDICSVADMYYDVIFNKFMLKDDLYQSLSDNISSFFSIQKQIKNGKKPIFHFSYNSLKNIDNNISFNKNVLIANFLIEQAIDRMPFTCNIPELFINCQQEIKDLKSKVGFKRSFAKGEMKKLAVCLKYRISVCHILCDLIRFVFIYTKSCKLNNLALTMVYIQSLPKKSALKKESFSHAFLILSDAKIENYLQKYGLFSKKYPYNSFTIQKDISDYRKDFNINDNQYVLQDFLNNFPDKKAIIIDPWIRMTLPVFKIDSYFNQAISYKVENHFVESCQIATRYMPYRSSITIPANETTCIRDCITDFEYFLLKIDTAPQSFDNSMYCKDIIFSRKEIERKFSRQSRDETLSFQK